ncbi:MAG: PKD domain-containing protein [Bacteroidia bacterium]|nr:PKD domain-containing protein [Bacteroidia bacterium]
MKYKYKGIFKALMAFLMLFLSTNAKAQISSTGKEFYMSFMEMETRNGGYPDTLLIFVTSEEDTKVTLDNPRLTGSSQTYNIQKNKVNRIAVDANFYYPIGSEFGVNDQNAKRSLRIVAQKPVNVYCINLELNRSDGTFVMPYESIPAAPEYFVVSFPPNAPISGGKYAESEFVIVSMDNNVKVEITPSVATKGGKTAGTPFTVSLGQKGTMLQVQSPNNVGTNNTNPATYSWTGSGAKSGDLTGTRIRVVEGCGKINVFSGTRSSHTPRGNCAGGINGRDHLYTQVLPTVALGKEYVLMPYANQNGGYVYKVIAAYDSTKVFINGTLFTTIPKKGDWIYQDVTNTNTTRIVTDKPAYCAQYMKNGVCNGWSGSQDGDAAVFISPDVNQRLLRTIVGTATTSNMKNHWVNILVDKSATKAVKLNGTLVATASFKNTNDGKYAYAQIKVNNPSSNIIECDSGCIVVAYGTGPYESYTYSAGALFENVEYDYDIKRNGKCPSEPVKLVSKNKNSKIKGTKWNFGDGSPEEWGDSVTHKFSKIGTYYVLMKVVVPNACNKDDTIIRSKIINVLPGPVFSFPDTTTQCANTLNVQLKVPSSAKFTYKWHDNSTANTFTATKDGFAWVRVLDTSTNCAASDTTYVRRANVIYAGIKYDTLNQCYKQNVFDMTDGSKYNDDGWKVSWWSAQYEHTKAITKKDSAKDFKISFDSLSTNNLRYIVQSRKGCRDTLDTTLIVHPYPIAKINFPVTHFCQNAVANVIDSSSSPLGVGRSFWDFGDGSSKDTTSDRKGRHVFKFADTFNIRLITETPYFCHDTIDSLFIVYPVGKTEIGSKIIDQCKKTNSFEFYDNTTIDIGSFTDEWQIAGKSYPNQGTLTNIKFSDTGTQKILLITETDKGCRDSALSTVFVAPEPKAILTVTDSSNCFDGHFFDLECKSTVALNSQLTARSDWKFSDGTSNYAKVITSKKFNTEGVYWVRLIATTVHGCMDSVQKNLTVYNVPDASISPDNAVGCLVGNRFNFKSANKWTAGGKLFHDWTFGDGSSSSNDSFVKIYAAVGTYNVKHVVTSNQSCKDSAVTTVTVVNTPTANFTVNKDTACYYSQDFDFVDRTNFSGSFTVLWDFNDGTTATGSTYLNKTFTSTGKYPVKMVVTSSQGCKDSMTKDIKVFSVPVAKFTVNDDEQCVQGNSFVFTNTSNENGATTPVMYGWQIAGSSGAPIQVLQKNIPTQTLTDTGIKVVTLGVASAEGCLSTQSLNIYVAETPLVSITGKDACASEEIQFGSVLLLNKGTASYSWDFGNGSTSTSSSPKYTYNTAGPYLVNLNVVSSYGCTGKASAYPVNIYVKPKASFTSEYLLSKGLETDWRFDFTGSGATDLEWVFQDGQVDYGMGPINKTFSATGDFKVRLMASTPSGCKDSASAMIFLKPELLMWLPTAFSPNIDGLNEGFGPYTTFGLERYELMIFDRWGNIMWKTTNPEEKWLGYDNDGTKVPEGVYGYSMVFRYVDNQLYTYKGTVTLLN